MIREAVKYFGRQGGNIINIGSLASRLHQPNLSLYSASKSGSTRLTGVLAKELGRDKFE